MSESKHDHGPTENSQLCSKTSFKTCDGPGCLTCPEIKIAKPKFTSTITNRVYKVLNHTNDRITCKSNNIIYLMTCKKCGVQYVGETGGWYSRRNNSHRSKMRCVKSRLLIYKHSHLDEDGSQRRNSLNDFIIQPIEVLAKNTKAADRIAKEEWWMKELKTLYPYGLNDKCGNTYFSDYHKDRLVYSVFNKQIIKRKHVKGEKVNLLLMLLTLTKSNNLLMD